MRKRALTPYLRSASRNALPRFGSDVVDARYSSIAQADSPDFDRRLVSSVIRPPARYGVVRPSTLGGVAKRLTTTTIPIVKPNQRASRPKNSVIATLVAGSRLRRLPEPWVCGSPCRGVTIGLTASPLIAQPWARVRQCHCLLYTSDAADDLLCV